MATYFVASGGSNTAPYDTWAKAATSLQTALTAASSNGDIVVVQKDAIPTGDAELAADTTYTLAANIQVISATNDGGSAYTPSTMGTATWIGNSTTNRSITFAGGFAAYFYGLTLRVSGTSADSITLANTAGARFDYEECYFWQGSTNASSGIAGYTTRVYLRTTNCTFRFGATGQGLLPGAFWDIVGGSISADGSTPTTLFRPQAITGACVIKAVGVDVSLITGTLVAAIASGSAPMDVHFDRCKFGSGVVVLAAQSTYHGTRVLVTDCSSGDTHNLFGYYDQFGSLTSDTGIYVTSGAAAQSWKIVTTANASFATPFISPPIPVYNTGTGSVTPYVEIARDGSTTAYQNDEVWLRVMAKVTSGSTLATAYQDRMTVGGTPANQASGAGTGSWTGLSGTAWSGKIDSGSALTPAENGDISARIAVGEPSITVYADPYIRT